MQEADSLITQFRALAQANDGGDHTSVTLRAAAIISRLKAVNRTMSAVARQHKQASADARVEMDNAHLGLQNLYYERRHLENEIEKCRKFASIYQDLPLYSLEDFRKIAPSEAQTEEVFADEHQLMLNRLNFELAERLRLDTKRRELTTQRDLILREGKVLQTKADGIKQQVEKLAKTASDVQKSVDAIVPAPET